MEQITERIAGISLPTVLLILVLLTALRAAIHWSRAAFLRATGEVLESVILAIALVFLILRPFVVQSYFIPSGSMHPTLWEGDHILVNKWLFRTHTPSRGDVIVFRAPIAASSDEKEFIKRVVGVPGDVIEVQEGFVEVGPLRFTRQEIRQSLGENLSVEEWETEEDKLPPLRLTTDALWLGDRRITPEEFAVSASHAGETVRIHPGRVLRNGVMLMESYVAEDAQYHMPPCVVPPGELFVMGDNRNLSRDSHEWGTLPMNRIIGRADLVFWPVAHAKRIRCSE